MKSGCIIFRRKPLQRCRGFLDGFIGNFSAVLFPAKWNSYFTKLKYINHIMANYTPGDFIFYNQQSYALIEKATEDGLYDLRIGSRIINNVPPHQIEGIKLTPKVLSSAGFLKDTQNKDLWISGRFAIRLLPKLENENEYEVMVGIKNSGEMGGKIYFLDFFDQLQEFFKEVHITDLPTNFSYTID